MISDLIFPSIYLTKDGEEFILVGVNDKGKIIGARDFKLFDPETLRCSNDPKYDLMERKNPQKENL